MALDRSRRLVAVTDSTGSTTFEYNAAGRPVAERHDRSDVDLQHAYDNLGRRRRLELRRNGELLAAWEHDHDGDGRIMRIVDPAGAEALLTYDPTGRLAEVRHSNGVTSTWAYDAASQPVDLTLRPSGEVLSRWELSYDVIPITRRHPYSYRDSYRDPTPEPSPPKRLSSAVTCIFV